jgi:hypothetical protein
VRDSAVTWFVPLGFLCDHVEVLYDLDYRGGEDCALFIFALRHEFYGQLLLEFEAQIREFSNEAYRFNLLPLTESEAREAIINPLGNTSLKIQYDEDFVDKVLLKGLAAQTGGGADVNPPHLQIVCNQPSKQRGNIASTGTRFLSTKDFITSWAVRRKSSTPISTKWSRRLQTTRSASRWYVRSCKE